MTRIDSSIAYPRRYVALDRDGTVIVEKHRPLKHPDEVEFIEGAIRGLQEITSIGLGIVLITNQSGVGRGLIDQSILEAVHNSIINTLRNANVILDGIYVCEHAPWHECICRKPKPGLLLQASEDLGVTPESFIVIGDKISDIDCGKAVGATTILVRTGYGTQLEREGLIEVDYIVDGLPEAAEIVKNYMGVQQYG